MRPRPTSLTGILGPTQNFDTIYTETWSIALPTDWRGQGETEEGALYFESADGTKAFYVSTWDLSDAAPQTSAQVAASFKQAGLNALQEMDGYVWTTIADEMVQGETSTVVLLDSIAETKNYRIAGKVLTCLPIVVRAAFHDYACSDYEASMNYFAPIIASLRIVEQNPDDF